jgi:hypothetical protein
MERRECKHKGNVRNNQVKQVIRRKPKKTEELEGEGYKRVGKIKMLKVQRAV